jgi:hypothetical protein
MSSDDSRSTDEVTREAEGTGPRQPDPQRAPERLLLIPYPKFVFFYPSAIVCFLGSIILYFSGCTVEVKTSDTLPVAVSGIFMAVFTLNLLVIVFDFPRGSSFTLFFVTSTLALLLWLLLIFRPTLIPFLEGMILAIRPVANSTFFFCFFAIMAVFFSFVLVSTRFEYWELSANELIHHHGFWADMKRYPAPNLRVDKEVNDVFEYLLLGAGRLVLHPATEDRAIVLDNILFVDAKEQALTKRLGAITVNIQNSSS